MIDDDGTTLGACTMLDVSLGGARLRMDSGLVAAPEFTLLLSSFGASVRRRCAVVWQADQDIGIRFLPS